MKWQIPYAGETYVMDDARLTASEARLQKRITDGLRPAAADVARQEMDPDAWVAALVIARRRIGLEVGDALDVDADEIDLMACMEATVAAAAQEPSEPTPDAEPATT